MQHFTDAEIRAKAEALGLIEPGTDLPRHQRSKVVAALLLERRGEASPSPPSTAVRAAREIVIQPGGVILVDGAPFPWLVARERVEVGLDPDFISTVRLTLLAESVQIIKPDPESETS
ncbi:hypothetical protein [Streptomyces syringium]|uniref:hypothetical protein n=1 Tax=Streptomyces syringium TaxID=76729 RepID=UPI003451C021